ncbi:M56 and DUF3738 domain-containing protein [Alloacidobacterium sp.]|uniref:M56 and DUF3738 domain-containing protein n=1 Tax=Alloacidobacterium sp. TaxID=2951999 RepID=UPI002D6BB2CC|nr:M56 and DUF3738 domain-containing protein [Alloacidobacterium sp.]HYK37031.1 M56 and DUF3738 domain-containing protein [Alloacidobacterium sp.]
MISTIGSVLGPAMANHLWQSTLFALCMALLAVLLRKGPAHVRFWLWLAASLKFLLPFSLLTGLGGHLAPSHSRTAQMQPAFYYAMDVASQPFTFASSSAPAMMHTAHASHFAGWIPSILSGFWICGFIVVLATWCVRWRKLAAILRHAATAEWGRELEILRRLELREPRSKSLRLVISKTALEPGIFGIFEPMLVWPEGISNFLDDAQIESIIAHELLHVRRRDNLAAALHMLIESIFWFHPLVWWIEARLMEERERACDEGALRLCDSPWVYAESILKACEFSVAPPLPCVAGVTGANLKKRIIRIMTENITEGLSMSKKALLIIVSAAVIAGPIIFGLVNIPKLDAQLAQVPAGQPSPSFEVASVKPSHSADNRMRIMMFPGKFTVENVSLGSLIMFAYDAKSEAQISGGPSWIKSETFNIDAKEDDAQAADLQKLPPDEAQKQIRLMVQSLLADRFKLKVSHQMKELPVYALVVAKNGPKLTPSKPEPSPAEGAGTDAQPTMRRGIMMNGRGELQATGVSMSLLADVLSRQRETGGRIVIDKTGLAGNYDWTLHWTPESPAPLFKGADNNAPPDGAPTPDTSGPTFFTALEEQLGLKLEPQKGSVETLVIDSAEQPTAN